jgi:hypothetical protein
MKQTSIENFAGSIGVLYVQFMNGQINLNDFQLAFNNEYEQAKEMHKQEMASNCSQPVTDNHVLEISDEQIEKVALNFGLKRQHSRKYSFIQGAKWYREQLKNK